MKKMQFKTCAICVVLGVALLFSGVQAFAGDHPNCTISKLGVYPSLEDAGIARSGYPIFLKCDDLASQKMFYLSFDMGDAGLATALTAISLGQPVWARTTTDDAGGIVTVMYLSAN